MNSLTGSVAAQMVEERSRRVVVLTTLLKLEEVRFST